jgi:DNA-directed RNA polymerase subunit RPC12/RpoP
MPGFMHEDGELTCPRCGETLLGDFGNVSAGVEDGTIRTAIDCPDCSAPLDVCIALATGEALGVDVWVEDREDGLE